MAALKVCLGSVSLILRAQWGGTRRDHYLAIAMTPLVRYLRDRSTEQLEAKVVAEHLAECWGLLWGKVHTRAFEDALPELEELTWSAPILEFSFASAKTLIDRWSVNIETGTAQRLWRRRRGTLPKKGTPKGNGLADKPNA